MELIMLIGIPGSGKSSFYRTYFFNTHMRVSLDLFNTRNKVQQFMQLGFELHQRMVLDNTNVTKDERMQYILQAKAFRFAVTGYYFESQIAVCLERNEQRTGKEKINKAGVLAKHKALDLPGYAEGFDKLYYVSIEGNQFKVNDWKNEI
jgi:predicted kinase